MNQEIYNNYVTPRHSIAYSSPGNVKRHYGNRFREKDIADTLQHVDSYTLHRLVTITTVATVRTDLNV